MQGRCPHARPRALTGGCTNPTLGVILEPTSSGTKEVRVMLSSAAVLSSCLAICRRPLPSQHSMKTSNSTAYGPQPKIARAQLGKWEFRKAKFLREPGDAARARRRAGRRSWRPGAASEACASPHVSMPACMRRRVRIPRREPALPPPGACARARGRRAC